MASLMLWMCDRCESSLPVGGYNEKCSPLGPLGLARSKQLPDQGKLLPPQLKLFDKVLIIEQQKMTTTIPWSTMHVVPYYLIWIIRFLAVPTQLNRSQCLSVRPSIRPYKTLLKLNWMVEKSVRDHSERLVILETCGLNDRLQTSQCILHPLQRPPLQCRCFRMTTLDITRAKTSNAGGADGTSSR